MNSIASINPLFTQDYSGADIPVAKEPLVYFSDNGSPVPSLRKTGKFALCNTLTGDMLGICSKNYKIVTHKEMIDNQRMIIARSGLDISGIEERIVLDGKGARCYVTHVLPSHKITTPEGDEAALSFLGTNSYDGFFSFILSVGARQGACMNGQVFTSGASTVYKSKHNQQLDIRHAADVVYGSVKILESQQELWSKWYHTQVTDNEAMFDFMEALELRKKFTTDCGSDYQKLYNSNRSFKYLVDIYNTRYRRELGHNQWAVYNALTHWATHASAQSKRSNVANINHKRSAVVQKFISNDYLKAA